MIISAKVQQIPKDTVVSEQAVAALVGQTPRVNWLDGAHATVTRAWVSESWLWVDLELPDDAAGVPPNERRWWKTDGSGVEW